jgi:hypothetical protein
MLIKLLSILIGETTNASALRQIDNHGGGYFDLMGDADQLNVAAHFGYEYDYENGGWVVSGTPAIIQRIYAAWVAAGRPE